MREVNFEQIVVIGYGVIAGEILAFVHEKSLQYGYSVTYIEYEVYPFNGAKKYAGAEKIEYRTIEKKEELLKYLTEKAKDRLLIISANNNYLFPSELISKNKVSIINFHNALLPDLPGRNAPSWAIYEGRKETGITWHYVTGDVDAGDIIIQKKCAIDGDIKAYELVAIQMKLAFEAFAECFADVLKETAHTQEQVIRVDRRIYKSYEIPAEGRFRLTDPVEEIYRLLRSMDYGKNDIFPRPVTEYGGNMISIQRYKKVKREERINGKNRIYLALDERYLLMLRYDTVKDSR